MSSLPTPARARCDTPDQRDTLVNGPSEACHLREQSGRLTRLSAHFAGPEPLVIPVIYFQAWARKPCGEQSVGASAGSFNGVDPGRPRTSLLRSSTGLEVGVMSEPATARPWRKTAAALTASTHTSHQGAL
jgi:hypothetical protein